MKYNKIVSQLSENWKVLVGFGVYLLGMRYTWEVHPGIFTCALFWLGAILFETIIITGKRYLTSRIARGITTLGILSNMVVTLANGGYMPVLSGEGHSLWVTATNSHRLMPLADIYSGFSIGDFAIGLGFLVAYVFWIWRNHKRLREIQVKFYGQAESQ